MSIPLVVTRGFGNGTFEGEIKDVITAGFTIPPPPSVFLGKGILAYSFDNSYFILNPFKDAVRTISADYFVTASDEHIICENAGIINVTLFDSPLRGDKISIKRKDGTVNVLGTIDGQLNLTINVVGYDLKLMYDGTEWVQI